MSLIYAINISLYVVQHGIKREKLSEVAKKAKAEKDKTKIENYRNLTIDILQDKGNKVYTEDALNKTTSVLLLNPEFYTVWNYRREILLDLFSKNILKKKEALEDDLKIVMSQLKRFPKCYWVWNHRIWCLNQLQATNEANWDVELAIVSKLLEMDSRNFHGWQYRRFLVENIQKKAAREYNSQSSLEELALLKINIKEFEYTTSKINKNISNFSAWHNRTKLIPKIYSGLKELDNKEEFSDVSHLFQSPYSIMVHDLELIKTGMYMDPEDTSVWLYLYWLITDKFFVDDLRNSTNEKASYKGILREQLKLIEELNALEKDDNVQGLDNCWCLKSIILIKGLIKREEVGGSISSDTLLDENTKILINKLIEIDPLRKGRYLDQLKGVSSIISIA
ncbi:unnamed protein product [Debaryomyces tyrocola]|nr:unnamed protein product [Debaryomyces tyrocola]